MAKCVRCGGQASWRLWELWSGADFDTYLGAYCAGCEVKVTCSPWYATPIVDGAEGQFVGGWDIDDTEEEGPFVGGWDIDDTEEGS